MGSLGDWVTGKRNYVVDASRDPHFGPSPAAAKKVADSSDSESQMNQKIRMTSQDRRRNKVGYNILLFDQVTDFSKQKKNAVSEDYNTFIDDSELAIDERQFFAQTKKQGFYVSSGEVALLKEKYVQCGLILSLNLTYLRIGLPRNRNPNHYRRYYRRR